MTTESSQQNFAWAVKNPMTFVALNANWTTQDTSVNYMWHDKNVVAGTDAKSIFDPSPIGWKLAINGTWSNFSLDTFTVSESGRTYTDATAYYPYAGRLNTSGALSNIGSSGYYWSSCPYSAAHGSYLLFYSSTVTPSSSSYRALGYSLRAIREN